MSIADRMAQMGGDGHAGHEAHRAPQHEADGGDVHEHLKALHAAHGGKHMHIHHDGGEYTTHHIDEDGNTYGPHDHENMEALKDHMDRFLSEEEHEGGGSAHMEHEGGKKGLFA